MFHAVHEEAAVERVERSIEIDRPVRMVYDQFTQFEEFPLFMEGVLDVEQIDERTLHWRASVAGRIEEWDAQIVAQIPDQQIAWRHLHGAVNRGVVTFTPLEGHRCRVRLALEYDPRGPLEKTGHALGFLARTVEGDLERFKEFVEERSEATGGYRGELRPGDLTRRQGGSPPAAWEGE